MLVHTQPLINTFAFLAQEVSEKHQTYIIVIVRNRTTILLTVPILKGEIRLLPFDIEGYFFIPSKVMKINIIKYNQER